MRLRSAAAALLAGAGALVRAQVASASTTEALHLDLVGAPEDARFHLVHTTPDERERGHTLIFVRTAKGLLAALRPTDASVAWRHSFPPEEPIGTFYKYRDVVLATTTPSASSAHLFQAATGKLLWSVRHHEPSTGLLPQADGLRGSDVTFLHHSVVTLANARVIRAIDGSTGNVTWTWEGPNEPSTFTTRLVAAHDGAEAIGAAIVHRSASSYSLAVAVLDGRTGEQTHPIKQLGLLGGAANVLPLADAIVWLDPSGVVHAARVTFEGVSAAKPYKSSGSPIVTLETLHMKAKRVFLARRKDTSASVLRVDGATGKVSSLWDFTDPAEDAHYSGSVDRAGGMHVTRAHYSSSLGLVIVSTFSDTRSAISDTGMVQGQTISFDRSQHGSIVLIATEVAPHSKEEGAQLLTISRSMVVSSSGSVQLWQGGQVVERREEGRAHVEAGAIAFVDLTEPVGLATRSIDELYAARLVRHAIELYDAALGLRGYIRHQVAVLLRRAEPRSSTSTTRGAWLRSSYGFRKIAVLVSSTGKVFALDPLGNGTTLWERNLLERLPRVPSHAGFKTPAHQLTAKAVVVDERLKRVLIAAEVSFGPGKADAHAFTIDATTGALVDQVQVFRGAVATAFALPAEANSEAPTGVAVVANDRKVYIFPPTAEPVGPISYVLRNGPHELVGYRVSFDGIWTYSAPTDEVIATLAHQSTGPIASLGRVLGDRNTLYKYLNPHLLAVASVSASSATISVLDSITGEIVWFAAHVHEVHATAGVQLALSENWLVYAFRDRKAVGQTTRVVSVELYREDAGPPQPRNATRLTVPPAAIVAYSRSFMHAHGFRSLAMTETRLGVTLKNLLVVTDRDQLLSIPRPALDPRRPFGKPTKAQQEEMLMPYDPLLPADPRWVVSHTLDLVGASAIATASTLLESSALVVAYGHDVFAALVTPSGSFDVLSPTFNRLQLLLTLVGLAGGIVVTRPMVRQRQLRSRWYDPS